jgi:hypothetical protein
MDSPQQEPRLILGSDRLLPHLYYVSHAASPLRLAPPFRLSRQKVARKKASQLPRTVGPRLFICLCLTRPRNFGLLSGYLSRRIRRVRVGCVQLKASWRGADAGTKTIHNAVGIAGLAEQFH